MIVALLFWISFLQILILAFVVRKYARNNNLGTLVAFMPVANRSAQRRKGSFKSFSSGGGGFRAVADSVVAASAEVVPAGVGKQVETHQWQGLIRGKFVF